MKEIYEEMNDEREIEWKKTAIKCNKIKIK